MLSCPLIVSRHARRFVLLPAVPLSFHHRHSQPSKSHQIISFADPHPLTLLESYRFKNMAGRGHSRRSDLRKFQPANFPHPPKSFPYHTSENSPVSPTIATLPKTGVSNPCVCHTSETPRGVSSVAHPRGAGRQRSLRSYAIKACLHPCAIIGLAASAPAKKANQE